MNRTQLRTLAESYTGQRGRHEAESQLDRRIGNPGTKADVKALALGVLALIEEAGPEDNATSPRLMLNAYGRRCFEAGVASAGGGDVARERELIATYIEQQHQRTDTPERTRAYKLLADCIRQGVYRPPQRV